MHKIVFFSAEGGSDRHSFSYGSYGWPVRSVERLPPYSPAKLKTPVLVIGNTVSRTTPPDSIFPLTRPCNFQADPITPFRSAQKVANLFGDDAFLVEQLGFGHTSFAQGSSCTLGVVVNYFANSTVCGLRYPMILPLL